MGYVLEARTSTIPGAGKGLFTHGDIRRGERIVEYLGEIITARECERRAQQDQLGYVFHINRNTCIDAYHYPDALARYANDACGLMRIKGITNNAVYEKHKGRGYIVATRNIKADSEILVSYGAEYWRDIRYNLRLEQEWRHETARSRRLWQWLGYGRELASNSWRFCSVFVTALIFE